MDNISRLVASLLLSSSLVACWCEIAQAQMPGASEILQPNDLSFWEVYRWPVVVGIAALLLSQSMLIAALLVQRSRRAKAEASRRRNEVAAIEWNNRYQAAVESSNEVVYDWNYIADSVTFRGNLNRIIGFSLAELDWNLDSWLKLVYSEDRETFLEKLHHVADNEDSFHVTYRIWRKDGAVIRVEDRGHFFRDSRNQLMRRVGLLADITERKRAEDQVSLLQTLTLEVAAASNLSAALEVVLRLVCEKTGWVFGQAWIPRRDGTALEPDTCWICGDENLQEFKSESQGMKFPPGVGLPGRVWLSKEPLWLQDVTLDENFPRVRWAERSGLKAALAIPILSDDKVIAVLEFFLRDPRPEDERLVNVIVAVAAQLNLVIKRKQAEEHFKRIFDLSPLRMGLLRIKDGVIVAVNTQWLKDFNLTREDVLGRPISDLHDQMGEVAQEIVRRVLREGKPVRDLEFRVNLKKGDERCNITNAEIVDFGGDPCFLWVTNDITERARAEDALRRNEELFRAIVEDQNEMIVRWKPDGTRTFVNRAYSRVFGGEPEDLIGTSFFPQIKQEYRQSIRRKVLSLTAENPLATEIHESIGADNQVVWQEWTDRGIFDEHGNLVELQSTGRDITERKRAEDALRASQEQLRALSARVQSAREEEGTRIAREIHDELGGALTGLKWDLEGIEKGLAQAQNGNKTPAIREKISAMTETIDSTIQTVRRISSDLRPGILDDLGLIAAIEWQSQQFQQRTGIECLCSSSVENIELSRDRTTAVFRIFQEILTNVLRHADATRVNVMMSWFDNTFALEVKDNGRGITVEEERNTNSLGLLGMHERAHLVGGTINISGVVGEGTSVVVHVPIN